MNYKTGSIGRVVWARFDDGDDIKRGLEEIALTEKIGQALVLVLGALKKADIVVGPKEAVIPPEPVWTGFADGREVLGVGSIAWTAEGPALHMHVAAGRGEEPVLAGCLRKNGEVYLVAEAVILETTGLTVTRDLDDASGLELLTIK